MDSREFQLIVEWKGLILWIRYLLNPVNNLQITLKFWQSNLHDKNRYLQRGFTTCSPFTNVKSVLFPCSKKQYNIMT